MGGGGGGGGEGGGLSNFLRDFSLELEPEDLLDSLRYFGWLN